MAQTVTRVIKVGGSLFDLPDLGERLKTWFKSQPRSHNILVAGGGRLADEVRRQHELRPLDDFRAHWLCVDAMDMMAHLLHHRLVGSALCQKIAEIREPKARYSIFKVGEWARLFEPMYQGTPLIESWDVTSDSIAARLAIVLQADELVLLKSADPPSDNLHDLAERGYVDRFLPKLADELPPWRIVNMRNQ
jgi:aspartokinase-like uncharacterized kinase